MQSPHTLYPEVQKSWHQTCLSYKLAKDSGVPLSILWSEGVKEGLEEIYLGMADQEVLSVFRLIRDKQTLKQNNGHRPG